MPDSEELKIEQVFVHRFPNPDGALLGYARLTLVGGLFISELRIYKDSKNPMLLYISFPTRQDFNKDKKVVYPVTDECRQLITNAITEEYRKMPGVG